MAEMSIPAASAAEDSVKPLFAAAFVPKIEAQDDAPAIPNTSWLTNASFNPNHATIIHERNKEPENSVDENSIRNINETARILNEDKANRDVSKKKKKKREKRYRTPSHSPSRRSRRTRSRNHSRSRSRSRRRSRSRSHNKRKLSRSKSRERKKRRSRSQSRDRKHKKKKKKHHKHKTRRSASSDDSPVPNLVPSAIFTDDIPNLAPEHRFRLDRKPDANNAEYGSLYKMHVAKFRRLGNLCLGCDVNYPVYAGETRHYRSERSVLSKHLYLSEVGKRVVIDKTQKTTANNSDFMLVGEPEKELGQINPLNIYDATTEQWLQGKGGLDLGPEPVETVKSALYLEIEDFNRYLREYPRDIEKWLQFVKYQDEFLKSNRRIKEGASEDMESRKVSDHLVIVKKLAILDKALKSNPGHVRLQTLRLELSRSILEPEQLRAEWRTFVLGHLDEPSIWRSFIMYHQCDLTRFTVRDTLAVYAKCLSTFNKLKTRQLREWVIPLDVEWQMLEIFSRLCTFLKQTGHVERAVAAYQAMVEFNFRPPGSVAPENTDHEIKLAVFEPFWDAGVPRFGEDGAPGWATWVKEKDLLYAGSPDDEDDDHLMKEQTQRKGSIWHRLETRRETAAWLPWRPDVQKGQGQEDMDDFDRVVLFDDIGSFLFTLQEPRARVKLITEFLTLLGVKVTESSRSLLGVSRSLTGLESGVDLTNYEERESVNEFVLRILENLSELTSIESISVWFDSIALDYVCSRNFNKSEVKMCRKFAKRILQKDHNRNNHDLWLKYAEFERRTGHLESSVKVIHTMLSQNTENTVSPELYKFYIKILLQIDSDSGDIFTRRIIADDNKDHVIYLCSCLVQNTDYNPSKQHVSAPTVLKTRRDFVEKMTKLKDSLTWNVMRDEQISDFERKLSDYLSWSYCFVVFQLLTLGEERMDACLLETARMLNHGFSSVSQREDFDRLHWLHEQFHSDRISLTLFSVNTRARSLSILRNSVLTALDVFPDSSQFIRLMALVESRSSFTGRWRRYVDEKVGSCQTGRLWVAALETDLVKIGRTEVADGPDSGRVEPTRTGLVHRLRALFDRATVSSTARTSLLVWRLYMKFEFDAGDLDRAKAIFYRSLQQCPWAKCLYLDAVRYFPADLEEITDLMIEKGIRLRCIPEELDIVME